MIIKVKSGLKQNEIIELLENQPNEEFSFKYLSKVGLIMDFEVSGFSDIEDAMSMAKKIIKSTSWGSTIYFAVNTH